MKPVKKAILRGNDPTGHGYYGAKRGNRKHFGLDLVTKPGEEILSPIDGHVTKIGQVYNSSTTDKFKYVEITNDVYRQRMMYVFPDKRIYVGLRVFDGDVIGKAQDIAGFWSSKMMNHIHWEVWKHGLRTDPEPLLPY